MPAEGCKPRIIFVRQSDFFYTAPPPDGIGYDFRFTSMADTVKAHQEALRQLPGLP
jgi:hypothetical protein